jgi:hypothetical protein
MLGDGQDHSLLLLAGTWDPANASMVGLPQHYKLEQLKHRNGQDQAESRSE